MTGPSTAYLSSPTTSKKPVATMPTSLPIAGDRGRTSEVAGSWTFCSGRSEAMTETDGKTRVFS
jgi:hypothetical protein